MSTGKSTKVGGLKINRNHGEKVFFFLAGKCLGSLVCESSAAEFSAVFSKEVIVKREETLTAQEKKLALS